MSEVKKKFKTYGFNLTETVKQYSHVEVSASSLQEACRKFIDGDWSYHEVCAEDVQSAESRELDHINFDVPDDKDRLQFDAELRKKND